MTDLYIVLISLAALIIFVVLVINWWQERKYRQEVERSFNVKQQDALLRDNHPSDEDIELRNESNHAITDDVEDDQTTKLNDFSQTHASTETFDSFNSTEISSTNKSRIEPKFGDAPSSTVISRAIDELDAGNPFNTTSANLNESPDEAFDTSNLEYAQSTTVSSVEISSTEISPENEIKAIFDEAFQTENPYTEEHAALADNEHPHQDNPIDLKITLPNDLHGQIDLIALLYLAADTPIRDINAALAALLNAYDKPTFVHVLSVDHAWLSLSDVASTTGLDTLISRVTCSIQLADRAGAVSRNTLNRFQLDVESAGLAINAHVAWQSTGDALSIANELDAFCVEVDQTVRFHLKHGENGAFTGTKLRGLAEAQGFAIATNGAFEFIDAATKRALFVMYNQDNHPFNPEMLRTSVVKGVTFELDIPHVKNCAEVFSQMVQVARQMEIGLNAILVDDNQKILGEIQIERIRQQLKMIHAKMLVKGIAPGSDEASRLFV